MESKKKNENKRKKKEGSGREYYDITMNIIYAIVSEPYFLFHFLTLFSYFSIRLSTLHLFSSASTHLFHRELQAAIAFLTLAAVKMVKEETWDGFVADMLLFAKVFLIGIALVVDYHLALWFTLTFLVIYLFTQQPAYMGLGSATQLTPLQLEALLTEGGTSRFWLVEFRSSFSSTCIRTSRVLPELSITFSNKNLSFGVVDLGLFPNTASKFGISLGIPDQLPTYILFEHNEEVSRFPEMHSVAKASDITKKRLCHHFELDKHLLDYVSCK
uniref:thioredoxin-related transmembrane protein 2 n=1 Tax=Erigeron canadensis TaxID=72917 RepID=UPI001CB90F19|nr:thioredoxin-related transmembrane protein 2 [Erigeron canadensis]